MNELDNKGKLIYQTPLNIYEKRRKKDLYGRVYFDIFFIFLIFCGIIYFIFEKMYFGICILVPVILVILFFMIVNFEYLRLIRFQIFENGYIPSVKPYLHYLSKKEYYIRFNDIKKIEYKAWGEACDITLKNGSEVTVSAGWGDIDGYIEFSKVIKKHFPKTKIPNLEIVKKRYIAWENYLDKKISKKEHDETFNEMKALNKEFMKPKLLN